MNIDDNPLLYTPDCIGLNEISLWDLAKYFSSEKLIPPSQMLKQLAYSALQWIQISTSYYPENGMDFTSYPDELKSIRDAYIKGNYDFIESRFKLSETENIEELLLSISAANKTINSFSEDEYSLLTSIIIYHEHFEEWLKRKGIKLPQFWFQDSTSVIKKSSIITESTVQENEEDNKKVGRRTEQTDYILEVIGKLDLPIMEIPEGQKQVIKKRCLENRELFTSASFDHAWSELSVNGKISIKNKEKYLKNQY